MSADVFAAVQSEFLVRQKQYSEALTRAQESIKLSAAVGGNMHAEGICQRVWAQVLAAQSPQAVDEIAQHMTESMQRFETGGIQVEIARTHRLWGEMERERGNKSAAREHFEKAAALFESFGFESELQQVRGWLTELPQP